MEENPLLSPLLTLLIEPLKVLHFDDEEIFKRYGIVWDRRVPTAPIPPYFQGVVEGDSLKDGETIEGEVVVIGSGAGGGVVAKELAEKGIGVILLEEGKYYTRRDFSGRFTQALIQFYRNQGFTFAVGNTIIPVAMGVLVGGSTAINTGTCFRTPEWILSRWEKELSLKDLSPEKMDPYFSRVEAVLRVERANPRYVGKISEIIQRGCEKLSYQNGYLLRNAPDCDGQGVCDYGCPTSARRSIDLTYIPLALKSGAMLITGIRAETLLWEGGKVVGVEGVTQGGKRIRCYGKGVILSGGAIMSPVFLLKQGIRGLNGEAGKNLTLHPALHVLALTQGEKVDSLHSIPQGYAVTSFHRQGILLLGAGLSLEAGAGAIPFVGKKFSSIMDRFEEVASFGVMVEDSPSGRVTVLKGKPWIFYTLKEREKALLKKGVEIISDIFLSAGVEEVYPLLPGMKILRSREDLKKLNAFPVTARSFRLVSFHPLGTLRMGKGPRYGLVDPSFRFYGIPGLYVVDGSVVPTSVGVNPQITIMALATLAGEKIAGDLAG
jgi:hypothetical protein